MYKVNMKLLKSCKKNLTEYLFLLEDLKSSAKTVKEKTKFERKIIKVYKTICKLKNYEI